MRGRKLLVWVAAVLLIVLAAGAFGFWAMGTSWFWEFQISAYEKKDRMQPPPMGAIVFTGSSSIRYWDTLSEDMKPLKIRRTRRWLQLRFGSDVVDLPRGTSR